MLDSIVRYLTNVKDERTRTALYQIFTPIADRLSSVATTAAALEIAAGGSTVAQIGSGATFRGVAGGVPVTIAAGTDMPALAGTITAASFNIFCFFVDSASVVTSVMGTEGTTLAKVVFPQFPVGKCLVGYIVVTYASTFTGGTTPLDTATTTYVSPVGAFDPTLKIS